MEPGDELLPEQWGLFHATETDAAARRRNRLAWLAVIAIGVIVFELTASPVLTVLVGCLKYGWDELRGARRLKRLDPNPVRGRVCARFLTAFGLWKVSGIAFLLFFLVAFLYSMFFDPFRWAGGPGGPPVEHLTAFLLAVISFLLSCLWSLIAIASALLYRVQVWVGRRHNQVPILILSVGALLVVPPLLALWLGVIYRICGGFGESALVSVLFAVMFAFFFLLLPVGLIRVLGSLEHRIAARWPGECWPELWQPAETPPEFLAEVQRQTGFPILTGTGRMR